MGNHSEHHNEHSNEKKPVAFTVPLIFASVVVLVIVLLVSLGDPSHGCECKESCSKECMDKCETGDHSGCEEGMKHGKEAHGHDAEANEEHVESKDSMATETPYPTATTDTSAKAPAHTEEHH